MTVYEKHFYENPHNPFIIGHHFIERKLIKDVSTHWHEDIEFIYMVDGDGYVLSGIEQIHVPKGCAAVVNSGKPHMVFTAEKCEIYYLIIAENFCNDLGIPIGKLRFDNMIDDVVTCGYLKKIFSEFACNNKYKNAEIKGNIILLLAHTAKNHVIKRHNYYISSIEKISEPVKQSLEYIRLNYRSKINVEDISEHVGYSKYYFCHMFKKETGRTVVDYINFLRCENARRLISSGKHNISESAELSGYNNISFFTKMYKKHIGILPSQTVTETYLFPS